MPKRSRKSKSRESRKHSSTQRPLERVAESRAAEVVTVFWMMTLLATLGAEGLGLLIRALAMVLGSSDRLQILSGTLLTIGLISGLMTLGLTVVTIRLRNISPPPFIVVVAVISGLVPIVTALLLGGIS